MGAKLLVTGGSGFIGAAVVRDLLGRGHSLRVLDNQSRGNVRRLEGVLDDIELIEADIRDASAVAAACKGMDAVFHLAYVNGTKFFYSHPDLVLDVAVRGVVNVLDGCRLHGVQELFVASSSEVYQTPPVVPTPETVPLIVPDVLNPRYSYGGGKIITELMALHAPKDQFSRVVLFRPHNVYGPDMGWEHVLPELAMRAIRLSEDVPSGPLPLSIQGGGQQTRAFLYVDDCADAVGRLYEAGTNRTIYNVGTAEEVTILHVAELVASTIGRAIAPVSSELPAGGTLRRCPDVHRIASLGFRPKTTLEEGVARLVEWYAANRSLWPAS